eukprot:scaffold1223_cov31-Tisochrysis_lutea.AAC.3
MPRCDTGLSTIAVRSRAQRKLPAVSSLMLLSAFVFAYLKTWKVGRCKTSFEMDRLTIRACFQRGASMCAEEGSRPTS